MKTEYRTELKEIFVMEELIKLLNDINDTYFDFVSGIVHYAEVKPSRVDRLLKFLRENPKVLSSDVVRFVSDQKDFFDDACEVS